MKKATAILVLACLSGSMMGMASCDKFWGVKTDPKTGEVVKDGGSPSDTAGGVLGMFFPWAAAAVSAAGNVYLEIRRRRWISALSATAAGINEFRNTPEGAAIEAKLMEKLKINQVDAGVRDMVRTVVHKLESK